VLIEVGDYIVKHGCIKGALARMMASDIMSEEELRRTNVFCHHYLSDTYTFASRALKTVFAVRIFRNASSSHNVIVYSGSCHCSSRS
jgi:hypothetical protein